MKSIIITGSSSGIGKATVIAFSKAGWKVAATMRNPEKETELNTIANVHLYALDVTDSEGVTKTINKIKTDFKIIDAVVNNAGYGVDGIFEAMSDEVIEKQFNTNVFGLMRVTRDAIKIMREQKSGTIIQIASVGGRATFPAFSIYHGTKWAVEGFSESLHYELAPFNIKVKIIEPGAIKTDFYGRSRQFIKPNYTGDYDGFLQKVEKMSTETGAKGASPESVAEVILKAATDGSSRMRYAIAFPANIILPLRRILPERWLFKIVSMIYGL